MRPNTMNRYGAVLDDFGLGFMLDKLMGDFVRPIAKGDTLFSSFVTMLGIFICLFLYEDP